MTHLHCDCKLLQPLAPRGTVCSGALNWAATYCEGDGSLAVGANQYRSLPPGL